ncbi:hypothetical protein [Brevibacillus sp. FIR094]
MERTVDFLVLDEGIQVSEVVEGDRETIYLSLADVEDLIIALGSVRQL